MREPIDLSDFDAMVRAAFATVVTEALPAAAPGRGWSVSTPDGFERVLLDHVLGAPWETALPRPCAHSAAPLDLMLAIELAGRLLEGAACLDELNRRSLALRGRPASCAAGPCGRDVDALMRRVGAPPHRTARRPH